MTVSMVTNRTLHAYHLWSKSALQALLSELDMLCVIS